MELVPGETLKGPVALDTALKYATQIASALDAAHEKGITHRDLKPGNIMLTPQGVIKVLDFGLAAVTQPMANTEDGATLPTVTLSPTQAGAILGTAAYMSPEQARGEQVDKRADIWSFGVVLYELLTGKRLFDGKKVADVLAAVLLTEPDLNVVPATVRKLLRFCLEKDADQRLSSIRDWRMLLGKDAAPATAPSRSKLAWGVAAITAMALLVLSAIHIRETVPEVPAINATLLPPENGEFDLGAPYAMPAISPDGTRVVFGARTKEGKQQLWVRRLDSPTAQPLAGTENAATPFWSPDSRWIGFGQDNKLKKIDIQGGPPVTLTDLRQPLRGGTWNLQGVILFGINTTGPIMRVSSSGGAAVAATVAVPAKEDGEAESHRHPWFLPDGRHFLYINTQRGGEMPIRAGSLDEPSKPGKVVANVQSPAVYSQGHLLYLRENTLMAHPFDVDRLETRGEAAPIAEGITTYTSPSRIAGFGVSPAGLLVYMTGGSGTRARLLWKDRQGKVLGTLGESTDGMGSLALSPDGKRLAADPGGDIWIYDIERGVPTRFTFTSKQNREAAWSSDGSTLYYTANLKGVWDLFRKASNGSGVEQVVLEDSEIKRAPNVSPDGKVLVYYKVSAKTGNDLWLLPLAPQAVAKPEPRVFLQTQFAESRPVFSPDGKWIAYQSDESGRPQVYVTPFPGDGSKRQISAAGGVLPRWRKDGKEIFFMTIDGVLMSAEVASRNATLEVGRIQKLFDGLVPGRGLSYDVTADGQKFIVADEGFVSSRPLTLVQNWPALLKK